MVAVARFSLPSDAAEEQSVVSCPRYGKMGPGGAPRDAPYSMDSITSALSIRTLGRSGAVGWSYVQWQTIPSET